MSLPFTLPDRIKRLCTYSRAGTAGDLLSTKMCSWVLAQGEHIVPIPGTKRRTYLEENIAAAAITLSQAELAQSGEMLPLGIAAGERYPDMNTVNR